MFLAPCKPHNRPNRQRVIARSVALLPDAATMVDRIEQCLATATPEEWEAGRRWYGEARAIADVVASGLELPVTSGAGIVAALSPQCSWEENVERALSFADGDLVGAFKDALGKADRIGAGQHPGAVLGGRKVRSFWQNIVGNDSAVTVDRHAVAIVYGRPLTDKEIKVLERPGAYTYVAAAYRTVARRHGLPASTLQAITWLAWRRAKGLDDKASF